MKTVVMVFLAPLAFAMTFAMIFALTLSGCNSPVLITSKFNEATVKGSISWPDGTPLASQDVSSLMIFHGPGHVQCNDSNNTVVPSYRVNAWVKQIKISTDVNGQFSVTFPIVQSEYLADSSRCPSSTVQGIPYYLGSPPVEQSYAMAYSLDSIDSAEFYAYVPVNTANCTAYCVGSTQSDCETQCENSLLSDCQWSVASHLGPSDGPKVPGLIADCVNSEQASGGWTVVGYPSLVVSTDPTSDVMSDATTGKIQVKAGQVILNKLHAYWDYAQIDGDGEYSLASILK